MEVRHPSFCGEPAIALLQEYDVALVVADSPGKWPYLERTTTGFMYARLHGHSELYVSGYSARSLDAWADKVRGWTAEGLDVFVYFDNDARGPSSPRCGGLLERVG